MTAATQDRDTQEVQGRTRAFPVEAATKIYGGTIACVNASGRLTKGIVATTLKAVGVALTTYDNAGGGAGAITGEVKAGVYGPFANSASADLIAASDVGSDCYIVDDSTVAKTNGTNTRSVAGKVWNVEPSGVWVKFA